MSTNTLPTEAERVASLGFHHHTQLQRVGPNHADGYRVIETVCANVVKVCGDPTDAPMRLLDAMRFGRTAAATYGATFTGGARCYDTPDRLPLLDEDGEPTCDECWAAWQARMDDLT